VNPSNSPLDGTICYEADFLPYGAENTPAGFANTCSTNYKFTGYERDAETANDYAFARYYSSRLGRFLSPDPMGGDITDPQTVNKYTYARNNPVNLVDPSGLCDGGDSNDPSCGCDPDFGCGCDMFICGDPCFPFGCEGGGGVILIPSPPMPPPVGTDPMADPWVFGCESLGIPCGMQIYRPPFSGIQLPSDSGCDWSGCDFGGRSHRPPPPKLFPGLEYAGFIIRVFVTEYLAQFSQQQAGKTVGNAFPNISIPRTPWYSYQGIDRDLCVAEEMAPVTTLQLSSKATEKTVSSILKRIAPGLAEGMKAAGPIAVAGDAVHAVRACWNGPGR
jgi:RHS repeat-associated protein